MATPAADGMRSLTTERLDLVPLDPDRDAASLHPMFGDADVFRFDPSDGPADNVAETRRRLAHEHAGCGGWTWAVRLRPSEEAIGTVGLFFDQGTPIRGLNWRMRRDYWGRGIMSEAAAAAVDHLLAQPGIDGVEAWIDTQNTRSLGVARHARLEERSRLPRVYADRVGQQVVMARAAVPRDPDVFAVRPNLSVRDVAATAETLSRVLGLHVSFLYGDPPGFGRLGVGPWSDSPGLELGSPDGEIVPANVSVDVGVPVDTVYERATAAGLEVLGPPEDCPWHRREFAFRLPEGHRVRVIGPLNPPGTSPARR